MFLKTRCIFPSLSPQKWEIDPTSFYGTNLAWPSTDKMFFFSIVTSRRRFLSIHCKTFKNILLFLLVGFAVSWCHLIIKFQFSCCKSGCPSLKLFVELWKSGIWLPRRKVISILELFNSTGLVYFRLIFSFQKIVWKAIPLLLVILHKCSVNLK